MQFVLNQLLSLYVNFWNIVIYQDVDELNPQIVKGFCN